MQDERERERASSSTKAVTVCTMGPMIAYLGLSVTMLSLAVNCHSDRCLVGNNHKTLPSPEPGMQACTKYSQSSCCYANYTQQLNVSPLIKVNNMYWNTCGQLSPQCEQYLKNVDCFYHCSPHAFHWVNPNNSYSIIAVPICRSYCDDWFTACKNDRTCARNWITDWEWNEQGNRCKNECIPFHQMFKDGKDLCESMWSPSFNVSSSNCHCLMLDDNNDDIIEHLLTHERGTATPAQDVHQDVDRSPFCQQRYKKMQKKKIKAMKQSS
eukprot:gi/632963769/ref/XP_007898069.1/ PREDICTED: riboflavin-binding protein-like isoform X2 [Callorhinchus milii]